MQGQWTHHEQEERDIADSKNWGIMVSASRGFSDVLADRLTSTWSIARGQQETNWRCYQKYDDP